MTRMFINYGYNTETEIFEDINDAIKNAIESRDENDAAYEDNDTINVNHYVNKDNGLSGYEAYCTKEGDMSGTQYIKIDEYLERGATGYWEDGWDEEYDITEDIVSKDC